MKILFLTSAHASNDDRIYFLQAKTLSKYHEVKVFSTYGGEQYEVENLITEYNKTPFSSRKEKIKIFYNQCITFNPDVIICSEPIPIIGANEYVRHNSSCRILYDVTEFYPSKKNLINLSIFKKFIVSVGMIWLNRKAAGLVDGFIFGEHYKSLYYRANFKNKPFIHVPYFQDLIYFPEFSLPQNKLTFGYTGKFSNEKGIIRFARFLNFFKENNPDFPFQVKLIGWFENELVQNQFFKITDGIEINFVENLPFESYCHSLSDISIFFDLRDVDTENNLCLPIKIFTYAAIGRPMIYSPLQAIQFAHPEQDFIKICKNEDFDSMNETVKNWISSSDEYAEICRLSRDFAEKYQWETIKEEFIHFVTTHE
jgi:glycosyltransferase involved in cell wall biosynthesis